MPLLARGDFWRMLLFQCCRWFGWFCCRGWFLEGDFYFNVANDLFDFVAKGEFWRVIFVPMLPMVCWILFQRVIFVQFWRWFAEIHSSNHQCWTKFTFQNSPMATLANFEQYSPRQPVNNKICEHANDVCGKSKGNLILRKDLEGKANYLP